MHSHATTIVRWYLALPALVLLCACASPSERRAERLADQASWDTLAYVGVSACESCHQKQTRLWRGSGHERAMAVATDSTVLADFNSSVFVECGTETVFFKEDDRFFVRTAGPTGRLETFEVSHTFGYRPLQQYLITFGGGRLQALTIAWDTEEQQWFSLYPEECIPHDDLLHWTQAAMNWNYMCADCHSTNLQRNFVLASNIYQTTFSEINVSCEACHGPGEAHVAWAEGEGLQESHDIARSGLTVSLNRDSPSSRELDTCAPCHSRRRVTFPGYLPGKPFLDHFEPALLDSGLYHADGQIQDEVFEYGSFAQSRMHAKGVRCSDCHDPHSTKLVFQGNLLCTNCHDTRLYDVPEHHHHLPESDAGQCISCHMPVRKYMVVDPRRDHSFMVPRPDLTVELAVPSACIGCHEDRTAQWAADATEQWYGVPSGPRSEVARTIALGRAREPGADSALSALARDPAHPPMVRASAIQLIASYRTAEATAAARHAVDDSDPLVQATAIRGLEERLEPDAIVRKLSPLLTSESRLVRMEAARVLARTAADRFAREPKDEIASAFWAALTEYRQGQLALSDQAAAHLNLAIVHEGVGELDLAEKAYQTALKIDSSFVPAHANLAMLYNRRRLGASVPAQAAQAEQYFAAAEAQLHKALDVQPNHADILYSLGLLLAERPNRLEDAVVYLGRASELAPDAGRIQYNTGLAYQQLGRLSDAERYLMRAYQSEPAHPDYINALSILFIQMERWSNALHYTQRLAELFADNPQITQRLEYVRARSGEAFER